MSTLPAARTYNQSHVPRPKSGGRRISIYWTWSYPWEAQRDPGADVQPLLHHDRGPKRVVAELRNAGVRRSSFPARHRRHAGALSPLDARVPAAGWRSHRPSRRGFPAHRPGRLHAADRRAHPRRHRHADGVRARPHSVRTRGRARRGRRHPRVAAAGRHLPAAGAAPRRRLHRRLLAATGRISTSRRSRWCRASSGSANTRAH